MKNRKNSLIPGFMLLLLSGMLTILAGQAEIKPFDQAPGPGFVRLFNGKDFAGWDIEPDLGAWVIKDGMIECKGQPSEPYLVRTIKTYENFDLYAEFNFDPGCNSGIFFHVPAIVAGRASRIGFEVQILDDAGEAATKGSSGAIYDQVAPRINAMKPAGQWNQYRVTFDYPYCQIWLNGELIQDVDFSQYPQLKYRLRQGIIGLSNHGRGIRYRNLWIKEFPDKEKWQVLFNGRDLSGWHTIGDVDWQVNDGMIVATRGEGYLVSDEAYQDFYFQAYLENDTLQSRAGCFYYRWHNVADPGYAVEFYDYLQARDCLEKYGRQIPETVMPQWRTPALLYQLISTDRESEVRIGGYIAAKNYLLQKVRPGKIAIYHSAKDGVLRIHHIQVRKLEGSGI